MPEKPMGVMPLCIIAIFLGLMGVLGGGMGIVGLLFDQQSIPPDKNPKLTELNTEFQRRMQEMAKETRPASMAVFPAAILASGLLAVAGIVAIQMKGLGLLKFALLANLLVDLGAAVFQVVVQTKSIAVMKWYFHELATLNAAGGASSAVEIGMQVTLYGSLFFAVFWLVLKLAYYVVGLVYFRKRAIVDAYSGRPAPEAAA